MKKPTIEVLIQPQYEITCGIDIHKDNIVTHISNRSGTICETKDWLTFTESLQEIAIYLKGYGVESVLMESTGVYWTRLYHILRDQALQVVVANPRHIKQMPKRKTDRKDAKWLCTLMMNGLVRSSFIPDEIQQEFRERCRNRERYSRLITQANNRIVRVLERANYKLRSVSSSIRTRTCQDIIAAIIAGQRDPEVLINLCRGKLKSKKAAMRKAVQGYLTDADIEQLELLRGDLEHYERQRERLNRGIEEMQRAYYEAQITRLDRVSGIGLQSAQQIVGEIGVELTAFENADHLTSWAGLAPGNCESGGKRKNTSTRKGNKHLRTVMIAVAWAAVRTKNSYWSYVYAYYKSKMPAQKAIVVIARKMLKLVYKIIKEKIDYTEGGEALYRFHEQKRQHTSSRKHNPLSLA